MLREHGRHSMLSYLDSLPLAVLHSSDIKANRFYDEIIKCMMLHCCQDVILSMLSDHLSNPNLITLDILLN